MEYTKSVEERYEGIKPPLRTDVGKLHDYLSYIFRPEDSISFDLSNMYLGLTVYAVLPSSVPYVDIVSFSIPLNASKGVLTHIGFDIDNNFNNFDISYFFTLRINKTPIQVLSLERNIVGNIKNLTSVRQDVIGGDVIDLSVRINVPTVAFNNTLYAKCYGRILGWYF